MHNYHNEFSSGAPYQDNQSEAAYGDENESSQEKRYSNNAN